MAFCASGPWSFHKKIQELQDQDQVYQSCVCIVPTDREEAPAWQRQYMYRQGAERYSLSCLGMVRRNWEWGLIGKDIPEQEQREVPGPVWIDWAWPRTGIKLITSHFRQFWNLLSPLYIHINYSLCLKKILSKWTKCAFQWCPAPNKDQKYLPKQDQESLSVPSLDCHSKEGASSWSCSINPNRTGNLSLLLPWTVSARQASLPGHLVSHFTGPFCYSCFYVKSFSLVLLGPLNIWPLVRKQFCLSH